MKRFLIYCVTYHSYKELERYVSSIDTAAGNVPDWQINICVADNTDSDFSTINLTTSHIHDIRIFPFHENLGYFGAVQKMMAETDDIADYDFITISNVDLIMEPPFFIELGKLHIDDNVGWIANAILSGLENRDRNPKILHRYSEHRLRQLRFMFKYPILHYMYQKTLYMRKKVYMPKSAGEIYAGHGSFILLTNAFIRKNPILSYKPFLFCEEIYLAELCMESHLIVRYEPTLKVRDTEHCSTGKMRKRFYYQCNYDAINYILKTFY